MFKIKNEKLRELINVSSFSYSELSSELHCSPNTITNYLHRDLTKQQKQKFIEAIKALDKKRLKIVNKLSKKVLVK